MKAVGVGAALVLLAACTHPQTRASEARSESLATESAAGTPDRAELVALCELPRNELSQGLSGTWFEGGSRTLFALQDITARIVPFVASSDFRSWSEGTAIQLTGRPTASWDGEALAFAHGELLAIAEEGAGQVERFDRAGRYLGAQPLPQRFTQNERDNKGSEGLAVSPDERFLFVANEAALEGDGPLATRALGTTVRMLRRELATGRDEQRAYRTEPLGAGGDDGEMGVSDVAALSDDELLVLERGYQPGYGNTVRIFRVDFRTAAGSEGLDAVTPLLLKTLVVDLGTLPSRGIQHDSPQPNPILENYEALSLGPAQADGRRLLFVTADDNGRQEQRARILVLAARIQ